MAVRTGRTQTRPEASKTDLRTAPQKAPQKVGQVRAIDLTEKPVGDDQLASPATPHLPHERDEVVGATGGVPSEKVRQGYRDVKRGLQDTSRAPEADAAYDKLKK